MGLSSFLENLQSKIEETIESLQSKSENISNNLQDSTANKSQEFTNNLNVSSNESPRAEFLKDNDDETDSIRNEKEDGWSLDDILALSNGKKAQDLLDSLSDEEKEALGLSQPKMGSMSEDETDWDDELCSDSSLADNDDEDE